MNSHPGSPQSPAEVVAIEFRGGLGDARLILLDQRRLPTTVEFLSIDTAAGVADAIRTMVVRGAPAIGIVAAYAVAIDALHGRDTAAAIDALAAARPTAVNLASALRTLSEAIDNGSDAMQLLAIASDMHAADRRRNRVMAALGADCFASSVRILTHCNTGSLATAGYGTALGVIRALHERQQLIEVLVGETRPWLQGARLTAWELGAESIPHVLIADSAAGAMMAAGRVDAVIVGADRIAANGDIVNKIGTYSLAVLAHHHGIPFMVVAPAETIDSSVSCGADIEIEQRDGDELRGVAGVPIAPRGSAVLNPVFDVTPADLVTWLVTERGAVKSPDTADLARIATIDPNSAEFSG